MRRTLTAAAMLVVVVQAATATAAAGPVRLAVLHSVNFASECERSSTQDVDALVAGELAATGRFDVVERDELGELRREIEMTQDADAFDPRDKVIKGLLKGAEYTLILEVSDLGLKKKKTGAIAIAPGGLGGVGVETQIATCRIDYRLVRTSTGELIVSGSATGEKKNRRAVLGGAGSGGTVPVIGTDSLDSPRAAWSKALLDAVAVAVAEVKSLFPVRGRIMAVADGFVYVDFGFDLGLAVNDRLLLYRLRDVVNARGEPVYEKREPVGEAVVTDVRPDAAEARLESGVQIAEGDHAVLP